MAEILPQGGHKRKSSDFQDRDPYPDPQVMAWLKAISRQEQLSCAWAQMWHLFYLSKVRIRFDFLEAASKFWSPRYHVFRFNDVELCPTIEDVSALLGRPVSNLLPLVYPVGSMPSEYSICHYFRIPHSELKDVCPDGLHIDLHYLTSSYSSPRLDRSRVIVFILVGHLLIRSSSIDTSCLVPTKILEICEAILNGGNPASVILADLFTSLDSKYPMLQMRGSPLLLQVWLEERIGYRVPRDTAKRCIMEYSSRQVALRISGVDDWHSFFQSLGETDIQWRLPSSPFTKWVHRLGRPIIYIIGTEELTSYLPERIKRQFGERQRIFLGGNRVVVFKKDPRVVERAKKIWSTHDTIGGPFINLFTSVEYKAWILEHVGDCWISPLITHKRMEKEKEASKLDRSMNHCDLQISSRYLSVETNIR